MISSLMDTWILVGTQLRGRHRIRQLYVLKSRGMPHSDEVRDFRFTSRGIELEIAHGNGATASQPRRPAGATRRTRPVTRRRQ
jgi:circadian clock protein KaiC